MRVIGLISGTSVDGIDAALVEISGSSVDLHVELLAGQTFLYPDDLRQVILNVGGGQALSMQELAALDDRIASEFAHAAIAIQRDHQPAELIGSHGQTVFHRPPTHSISSNSGHAIQPFSSLGYSLQLGRGALIAHLTQLPTISNFRAADIAVGGHGAPLVPAVDAWLFAHPTYNRCIQNIGGIGNVAYLPARSESGQQKDSKANHPSIVGWDTGPGNMLLDLAVQQLSGGTKTYDRDGAWAASGTPCQALVTLWLQQPFFQLPPPKSTGRESFGLPFLQRCFVDAESHSLSAADFLATLTEFTAASIAESYRRFLSNLPDQVLLCGGGTKNLYLKQQIRAQLESVSVLTTDEVGISADFKEAIAFAVLAYWRQQGIPGNLPEVTGARMAVLLGEIYQVAKSGTC